MRAGEGDGFVGGDAESGGVLRPPGGVWVCGGGGEDVVVEDGAGFDQGCGVGDDLPGAGCAERPGAGVGPLPFGEQGVAPGSCLVSAGSARRLGGE